MFTPDNYSIQLSLLRTGLVEEEELSSIWNQFQLIDVRSYAAFFEM